MADGHLTVPLVQGDLFGGNGTAQMILQQAPAGAWVATAKIAHADVDSDGEAAGLALVNRLNPNHFVKTALQYKSDASPDSGRPARQVGGARRHLGRQRRHVPPATVP